MKRIFTFFTLWSLTGLAFGQDCVEQTEPDYGADKELCLQKVSLYTEPLKREDLDKAAKFWWDAQATCPKYKTDLYDHGAYIYSQQAKQLKKAKASKEAIQQKVDSLFIILDRWQENFGLCDAFKIEKANYIMNFKKEDYETAYTLSKEAFTSMPENKITSSATYYYFHSAVYMVFYKKMDCLQLIELYESLSTICEKRIKNGESSFSDVQDRLDTKVADCATCDKIEEIFKPKYEAAPDDVALMEKILKMMGKSSCEDKEFFNTVAVALHKIKPTFTSACSIAKYYAGVKEWKKAGDYYEQADTLEASEEEKQKLYPNMVIVFGNAGNCSKKIEYAEKISIGEKNAAIAECIASKASSCGNNPVEISFAYCLALDYAEKSGGSVSSSRIAMWKDKLATTEEAFAYGLSPGQSVSVPCWHGEKTALRVKE